MKTQVLLALGLVASVSANHHRGRHHQRHAKKVSNQQLQQEIEELREAYNNLAADYEKLEKQTQRTQQSLVQGQSPYGLAGPAGQYGPAYPNPQPFVRGEKQWMDNAQNIGDWGDAQMTVANTRIPYQSVAQVEGIAPNGIAMEAGHLGGPALPNPQPFVRGEKQWMDNAQNIGDWGDAQMTVANTRIPYQSVAQVEGPYGNAGGNGKGPTLPNPQPFVRGEKQWMDNAQNIGDWGDNQKTMANTRIPYQSTLTQLEGPAPNGIATESGHLGGPALPNPQPFVRGEKQWMDNAQNIEDWGIQQMTVANTRIPYASTLVQLEGPAPNGIATEAGHLGGPSLPNPQPFVRGEKQWMDNAQNIEDWGIQQMTVANTRIPYASTLVQLDGPASYGIAGPNGIYGPAYPNPQPFVRGEKQWMDNAQNVEDWGIHQMEVANARIPYASTLVQLNDDDVAPEEKKEEKKDAMPPKPKQVPQAVDEPDMSILYEKEKKDHTPEKVMSLSAVPINAEFVQQDNVDPKTMEGFLMEDPNIPLNLRLLQTKQDDDPNNMESMVMDEIDIPRNMRLLHIKTHAGDELIKIVN